MQLVYRIERPATCKGPFQSEGHLSWELGKRANEAKLPTPFADGIDMTRIPWFWVFGAPSLEALKQWLHLGSPEDNQSILARLHEAGFRVVEFLVDDEECWVSNSGLQVAFGADTARDEGLCQIIDWNVIH